jgi:DNA-binding response OmpR family regulator
MHILVVEDNKAIAENEKRFLELEGHSVDVAYD